MDTQKKIKLLTDVKKLFDKNNIEFFPIYGTLLGFIRGKHIMPWDADIDLGAWYHDYHKVLNILDDFDKLGYGICGSGLVGKYRHISLFYKEDGPYDFHAGISFWAKDVDKAVELNFFDNNKFYRTFGKFEKTKIYNFFAPLYRTIVLFVNNHEVLPYSWFENMETIKVYGMDFKVMSNYEQYLIGMYGEKWREPEKSWSKKKHLQYNKFRIRYKIRDKKIRDLWIKREDINCKR